MRRWRARFAFSLLSAIWNSEKSLEKLALRARDAPAAHIYIYRSWTLKWAISSGGCWGACADSHTQPNDNKRHVGRNQPLPNACTCMLESIGAVAAAVMSIASLECRFTSHVYIVLSSCGILVWFWSISLLWWYNLMVDDVSQRL